MVTFLTPLARNSRTTKGSIGHAFAVRIRTENQDQASFCPFALREVSVLSELALGHLRYLLTDVPPQPNYPPDAVLGRGRRMQLPNGYPKAAEQPSDLALEQGDRERPQFPFNRVSKETMKVVVFHCCHC